MCMSLDITLHYAHYSQGNFRVALFGLTTLFWKLPALPCASLEQLTQECYDFVLI